jgi:hypothetical protein
MGLPVVPFMIGAAVGSVATYFYRDKAVREHWLEAVEGWYAGLASLWRQEKPAEQAVELAKEAAETTAEAVDVAREAVEEAVERKAPAEAQAAETESDSTSIH